MNRAPQIEDLNRTETALYMALELADKSWKLGFTEGRSNIRIRTVEARNLEAVREEIKRAQVRFQLPAGTVVKSCYEAGREGFWIHRWLRSIGVRNVVVDPSSMEVPRKSRRAKTDKIDVRKLGFDLVRHHRGENVWSVVRVPSEKDEDDRRFMRERERLLKEKNQHRCRIMSLLATQGIRMDVREDFPEKLEKVRLFCGSPLGAQLKRELLRQFDRLRLVQRQLKQLAVEQQEYVEEGGPKVEMIQLLESVKAIGPVTAWLLTMEFFGWRKFKNRKQVASAAGLTGTPYNSGDGSREQGISKAGNPRVRRLIIEIAWLWLRYQSGNRHSQWFRERFAVGKRSRRVGIVAVARKVLIDLWRLVELGLVDDIELKAA